MARQPIAYRRGLADAAVMVAVAHFWRNVRIEEIAKAIGIAPDELAAALARHRRGPTQRRMRGRSRPESPSGMKWCSYGEHFVPVGEMLRASRRPDGLGDDCREHYGEYRRDRAKPQTTPAYRRGLADAAVFVAAQRFHPPVRVLDLGKTVGLTGIEVQAAVKRYRRPVLAPALPRAIAAKTTPRPRVPKPEAPPGMKWCSRGKHFVVVEDMGKNRSRPDGLSDTCAPCWRSYFQERRVAAARSL